MRAGYAARAAADPGRFARLDAAADRGHGLAAGAGGHGGTIVVVDAGGTLPLPWLAEPLAAALATQRGHALLVHGARRRRRAAVCPRAGAGLAVRRRQGEGVGGAPAPAAAAAAAAWCSRACIPDLLVLLPETLRRAHDWPLADDKGEGDDGKRKPSRQIRIDEVRALIDWATRTSARGRGKVAVLHPAEALNLQSANALLKTLEEPPAGTRLVLTAGDPALLLPTVRSRCQRLPLPAPPADAGARPGCTAQGVASAEVLLAACSGRPLDALALAQAGIDAAAWSALPAAVARGAGGCAGRLAGAAGGGCAAEALPRRHGPRQRRAGALLSDRARARRRGLAGAGGAGRGNSRASRATRTTPGRKR